MLIVETAIDYIKKNIKGFGEKGKEKMREIKFKIWADDKFYDKCLVGNTNDVNDDKWTCPMVWLKDSKEWVHCDNGVICQYTRTKR